MPSRGALRVVFVLVSNEVWYDTHVPMWIVVAVIYGCIGRRPIFIRASRVKDEIGGKYCMFYKDMKNDLRYDMLI